MQPPQERQRGATERKRAARKPSRMRWLLPAMLGVVVVGYGMSQYRPAPELPEQVVLNVEGLH